MEPGYKIINKYFSAVLVVFVLLGTATSVVADGATRDLPTFYEPNVLMNVSIDIVTPADTVAVGLEDIPPSGWINVTNISDGGIYDTDNQKVKWPPFFDNLSRMVSYDITPPVTSVGTQCFGGIVSFDGGEQSIAGDDCVPAPNTIPASSLLSLIVMCILVFIAASILLRRTTQEV